MNQAERNAVHVFNPEAGDMWYDGQRGEQCCLVLRALDNGNVVITTKCITTPFGWEWDISKAAEVEGRDFENFVSGSGADVSMNPGHSLIQEWNAEGSQYQPLPEPYVDKRITRRYLHELRQRGYVARKSDKGNYLDGNHLMWMLNSIHFNLVSSQTKAHRWLGFVQCALCVLNVTTVDGEREFTRAIFNGK